MWNYILCLPFCLAANWTDGKCRKIPNKLALSLAVLGLTVQIVNGGPRGIFTWLTGMLPALLLLPFFGLRMMGAGDIKLLSALGGMMGLYPAAVLVAASLLSSGVLGAVVLLVRGSFAARFRVLRRYLKLCLLTWSMPPYSDPSEETDDSGKFAFSYGITCGLLVTAYYFCFARV